jgi:hypothetical protein
MARLSHPVSCLLVLAAMAGAVAAYGQDPAAAARDMKTYTNASWRWSIAYPAAWTLEAKDRDLVRIRSSAERALCSVLSGAVDRFDSVDAFTDFLLENDARFFKQKGQKFTVLSRSRISLPNRMTGNDVLVEIGPGGRSRRIHVLFDGRGFAVDCEAYTRDWASVEASYRRVISSFAVRR